MIYTHCSTSNLCTLPSTRNALSRNRICEKKVGIRVELYKPSIPHFLSLCTTISAFNIVLNTTYVHIVKIKFLQMNMNLFIIRETIERFITTEIVHHKFSTVFGVSLSLSKLLKNFTL